MSDRSNALIHSLESRTLLADLVSLGQQVLLADMNGDGKADRVAIVRSSAAGFNGRLSIALGNGRGQFRFSDAAPFSAHTALTLAVGDLDGDGKNDVSIAGDNPLSAAPISGTHVLTYLGNGDGKFKRDPAGVALIHHTFVPQIARAAGLSLADVDHDGFGDVSVLGVGRTSAPTGSTNLAIVVIWSPTLPTFVAVPPTIIPLNTLTHVNALQSADLDGDGKSDLIAFRTEPLYSPLAVVQPDLVTVRFPTLHEAVVRHGQNPLDYGLPVPTADARVYTMGVSDLNHNGVPELVGRVGNVIRYSTYNRAESAFGAAHVAAARELPAAPFSQVLIGDLDGDHLPDLLANSGSRVFVGHNVSSADLIGFQWHRIMSVVTSTSGESIVLAVKDTFLATLVS